MSSQLEPNHDERNMAALAASLGVVAALPIWLSWRRRSAFVRAHAAQSIAFDGLTVAALASVAGLAIGAALIGNAALDHAGDNDLLRVLVLALCAPGLALGGCLLVMMAALVFRLRAAMAANEGKPYVYPLLKKAGEILKNSQVFST